MLIPQTETDKFRQNKKKTFFLHKNYYDLRINQLSTLYYKLCVSLKVQNATQIYNRIRFSFIFTLHFFNLNLMNRYNRFYCEEID